MDSNFWRKKSLKNIIFNIAKLFVLVSIFPSIWQSAILIYRRTVQTREWKNKTSGGKGLMRGRTIGRNKPMGWVGWENDIDVCPSPILHKPQSSLSPLFDSSFRFKGRRTATSPFANFPRLYLHHSHTCSLFLSQKKIFLWISWYLYLVFLFLWTRKFGIYFQMWNCLTYYTLEKLYMPKKEKTKTQVQYFSIA